MKLLTAPIKKFKNEIRPAKSKSARKIRETKKLPVHTNEKSPLTEVHHQRSGLDASPSSY